MISGKAANGAQKGVKRWDFLHDSAHFVPSRMTHISGNDLWHSYAGRD